MNRFNYTAIVAVIIVVDLVIASYVWLWACIFGG